MFKAGDRVILSREKFSAYYNSGHDDDLIEAFSDKIGTIIDGKVIDGWYYFIHLDEDVIWCGDTRDYQWPTQCFELYVRDPITREQLISGYEV